MQKVTSSWFFLSTLNYDARSTTHQIKTYNIGDIDTDANRYCYQSRGSLTERFNLLRVKRSE